jgi:hypothetical protein
MDWKLSKETQFEFLLGRSLQKTRETALVEALNSLPAGTVVLFDDGVGVPSRAWLRSD